MSLKHALLGGTDGFRGTFTEAPGPGLVNVETFAGATYALIEHQLQAGVHGPVVVARDTRLSSQVLHRAAVQAAAAHDVEVWDLGVIPTPAAQKIALEHAAMATIVVTASHNPAADNGWKGMFGSDKLIPDQVKAVSEQYWQRVDGGKTLPPPMLERVHSKTDLHEWYKQAVVTDIERIFGSNPLRGKRLFVDGAYGATQQFTPEILRRLGATVEAVYCDNKGIINDGCGAANLSGIKQILAARSHELAADTDFIGAVANDGDGDRMMAVGLLPDGSDVEVGGNHVLAALALDQPGIVGTVYTNSGLVRWLTEHSIGFEYCAAGDINVTAKLRELRAGGKTWNCGGEPSGHHVVLDWLSSGDGVRMAAWFAAWAAQAGKSFAQIYQELPLWQERMTSVHLAANTVPDMDQPSVQAAIRAAEERLGDDGRLVVRPSGTEPLVRIWVESARPELVQTTTDSLTAKLQAVL